MTATAVSPSPRILVIGDSILDKHIFTSISRISPEAPVPVCQYLSESLSVGGAANVAKGISTLGATSTLITSLGSADWISDHLKHDLVSLKNSVEVLPLIVNDYQIPLKTRIWSCGQQLFRLDEEQHLTINEHHLSSIKSTLSNAIALSNLVVISDYLKGLLTPEVLTFIYEQCHLFGKVTVTDPKQTSFDFYKYSTIITPNESELARAFSLPLHHNQGGLPLDVVEACLRKLHRDCHIQIPLVTLGSRGVALLVDDKFETISPPPQEVHDVTGAGDAFIAALSTQLACGKPAIDAAHFACKAASITVSKIGTYVPTRDEVEAASLTQNKYVPSSSIGDLVTSLRNSGLSIGFTNGCFDIFHAGHAHLLSQARRLCDVLFIGLNSDSSIRHNKGLERPINPLSDRIAVLSSISSVDYIVVFDQPTPIDLIELIRPDVLIKGSDYEGQTVVGSQFAEVTTLIPILPGKSSSNIVEILRNG